MRDVITTVLEMAGLLMLDAAAFVALAPASVALGLSAVGVLLVGESYALEMLGRRKR